MDDAETTSHSFVVRVWIEEAATASRPAVWRGHITHVADGERRYFSALGDIPVFIAPYLETLGVTLQLPWRMWLWLHQVRLSLHGHG